MYSVKGNDDFLKMCRITPSIASSCDKMKHNMNFWLEEGQYVEKRMAGWHESHLSGLFGYIPMGLACGVLLQQAGYHWLAVMLMSLLIYGGASQFMIASMTVAGAGLLEMVIMIFFINLRHLLMSSSLAHRIREKSTAFSIFFAQTITDESFAVNTLYFRTDGMWNPTKAMAANVTAYSTWIISTGIGAMAGKSIALSPVVMNYILIAMFIFLLISQIENRIVFWTAVFSGITAVVLMNLLRHNIAIVLTSILASGFGLYLQNKKDDKEGILRG